MKDGRWLPEVHFLRAFAVALVVAFHSYPTRLRGGFIGVDVFFVLSGFLITRQIRDDLDKDAFSFVRFYSRRIARLLPASALVLAVCAAGVGLLVPKSMRSETFEGIAASALYYQNWQLAGANVDYFGTTPTLVNHFWSLSIEEQFYVIWPILVVSSHFAGHRLTKLSPHVAIVPLVCVSLFSFAFAFRLERMRPDLAYFATHARAWEFVVGGLLAAHATPKLPSWLASALRTLGVITIGLGSLYLREDMLFPGWPIVPVTGTGLVLLSGAPPTAGVQSRVLSLKAVRLLADWSYALYLWHWPLLVLGGARDELWAIPVSILVSVVLAAFTHYFVEKPLRFGESTPTPRRRFVALGSLSANALLAAYCFSEASTSASPTSVAQRIERLSHSNRLGCLGAQANYVRGCSPFFGPEFSPGIENAVLSEKRSFPQMSCFQDKRDEFRTCTSGKVGGDLPHVFLVGDSHMAHWASLFLDLSETMNFRLTMAFKPGCPLNERLLAGKRNADKCRDWVRQAITHANHDPTIDVIVTSAMNDKVWRSPTGTEVDDGVDGYVETWKMLIAEKRTILAIGDVPQPIKNPLECLEKNRTSNLTKCSRRREDALRRQTMAPLIDSEDPLQQAVKRLGARAFWFDPTNGFCGKKDCLPIVGNVLVYYDDHHITSTFARTFKPQLRPILEEAIKQAGPR